MSDSLRIALLGAGQLGGSFALALREGGAAVTITAYDPLPAHAEQLRGRSAVDRVAATAADAVADAEIVIFAAPMRSYRALASSIAPALKAGAIVTDLGSVKNSMAALSTLLPGVRLVPAHPIAGSEKSGPEAARGDLFQRKLCILTPDETSDPDAFAIIEGLWQAAGADVIAMPWQVHDQIYAYVSHLPHYIAFIAASYFHTRGVTLQAEDTVLHQFLRISRSNPRMWTDVALENREALLPALSTYIALLAHFATELRAGEKTEHDDALHVAKHLLPRVLAASLISSVSLYEQQSGSNLRPFGAGGMRDIVAPAANTPEADTEAISNAAHTMADAIDGILPLFRTLETLIGAEDEPQLFAMLSRMKDDAVALAAVRN
ncbi:MAG: prephenate dehydrogenase/arogenate dehydrogenase family protein [Pseudomonadota bacterium]